VAYIDQVVKYMTDNKASAFIIPAGRNVTLQVGDRTVPQSQVLSLEQVLAVIRESAPPAMQSKIGQPEGFEYPYQSASGPCLVRVRQNDGALELVILPQVTGPSSAGAQAAGAQGQVSAPPTGNALADKMLNVPNDRVGTLKVQSLDELFRILFETDASDLHCEATEHPVFRLHGTLYKLREYERWSHEWLKKLIWDIAPDRNKEEWEECKDTDFAYEVPGMARFRCNVYSVRHGVGATFRLIPSKIATVDELHLPKPMVDLCHLSKGLVLVTGPTGSGKSTTLAALVDHCNKTRLDHIITIEDPIEFVHENINCLVSQREVSVHTDSFKKALRAALREDPDIVLVGEMRDLETIAIAIETAETGHLVFGTLHTSSAATSVDRIVDQFPPEQQEQIRTMLSESLKAVISQMLLRKKTGGRIAVWEILLVPPAIANLIRERKTFQLTSMMQVNKAMGMITMNDAVLPLVKDGIVDPMEAYTKVIDKNGLAIAFAKEGIDFKLPTAEHMLK